MFSGFDNFRKFAKTFRMKVPCSMLSLNPMVLGILGKRKVGNIEVTALSSPNKI